MFKKLENRIENFYHSNVNEKGMFEIPNLPKEIAMLLIAVLEFVKLFTNEKTDAIIDKILYYLRLIIQK